jgi:hypothetical protein
MRQNCPDRSSGKFPGANEYTVWSTMPIGAVQTASGYDAAGDVTRRRQRVPAVSRCTRSPSTERGSRVHPCHAQNHLLARQRRAALWFAPSRSALTFTFGQNKNRLKLIPKGGPATSQGRAGPARIKTLPMAPCLVARQVDQRGASPKA